MALSDKIAVIAAVVAFAAALVASLQAAYAKRSLMSAQVQAASAETQATVAKAQLAQMLAATAVDAARHDWLLRNLERLRGSGAIQVPVEELPYAVFWLQQGLLEWVPTESSGKLNVRMRRSTFA